MRSLLLLFLWSALVSSAKCSSVSGGFRESTKSALTAPRYSAASVPMDSSASLNRPQRVLSGSRKKTLQTKTVLQKYVKKDCDLANDGPEFCAVSNEAYSVLYPYSERRCLTFIGLGMVVLILVVLVQFCIKVSTGGVSRSRDRHLKLYEETVFRQVAIVLLVVAVLEMVFQSRLFGQHLEKWLFGDISNFFPDIHQFASLTHVDLILDELLVVTLIFGFCFLLFAVYLALCAFWLIRWLKKADSSDVQAVAVSESLGEGEVLNFLALRFEFEEAVQQSSVPGLDPPGLYFVNYLRASSYKVAAGLLRIPVASLVIAFCISVLLIFTPITKVTHRGEVMAVALLAAVPLVVLIGILLRVLHIKRQLVPRDRRKYLHLRLAWDVGEPLLADGLAERMAPAYRIGRTSRSTCCSPSVASFFYGTRYPNNHETLFWFWRRGPSVIVHLAEICIFGQLVILAFSLALMEEHWRTWLQRYSPWAPILVVGICLAQWALIPTLLWNLTLVTATGGLINDKVLQEVWETQRSRTVQRFRVLLDCLRFEGNVFAIEKGGRRLRMQMADKLLSEPVHLLQEDEDVFRRLDSDQDGLLTRHQVYRFLVSKGVPVRRDADVQRWVSAFDRTNKGFLDREDFAVLAWNLRNVMNTELDTDGLAMMFVEKFNLPEEATVDFMILESIFNGWGVRWTRSHVQHLFQYMTGKRGTTSMNVHNFLSSLKILEANTIRTLQQAVGDLQNNGSFESSDNTTPAAILRGFSKVHK